MDKVDLIRKAVTRTFNEAEQSEFDHFIQTDQKFKDDFDDYRNMFKVIEDDEKSILKKHLQEHERKTNPVSVIKPWYIAASIFVVLGLSIVINSLKSDTSLFDTYFQAYPNTYQSVERSASKQPIDAFVLYENEDYKASSLAFENLLKDQPNNEIRFYYAMSLLNNNQSAAALEQLKFLEKQNFKYQAQTLWYKGLIYLKMNKIQEAKIVFSTLKQTFPNYKSIAREEILNELE